MKKLFASSDVSLISFYKALLDENGISSIVKNYYLTSGSGDIPPNEVVPELWIIDDDKVEEAKAIILPEKGVPWQCDCGEKISGEFSQCWKCGRMQK